MMVTFYLGSGLSLVGAALAPSLYALAVALFALGIFGAIYHPVGTAMLLENATQRGRTVAFNAVCGNIGVALAAGVTATLTAVWSWRCGFLLPGLVCIATGASYVCFVPPETRRAAPRDAPADVVLSTPAAATIFALFMVIALAAGLVINTITGVAEDRRRTHRQQHPADRSWRAVHRARAVRRVWSDRCGLVG